MKKKILKLQLKQVLILMLFYLKLNSLKYLLLVLVKDSKLEKSKMEINLFLKIKVDLVFHLLMIKVKNIFSLDMLTVLLEFLKHQAVIKKYIVTELI